MKERGGVLKGSVWRHQEVVEWFSDIHCRIRFSVFLRTFIRLQQQQRHQVDEEVSAVTKDMKTFMDDVSANWTNFKQASDVALAVFLNPGRDGEWGGACGWWGECEVWGVG